MFPSQRFPFRWMRRFCSSCSRCHPGIQSIKSRLSFWYSMTSVAFSLMRKKALFQLDQLVGSILQTFSICSLRVKLFLHIPSYSVLMEEILRCSSFSSFPITSACVFFSAARACCCLFHSCFRLSSFSIFFFLFRFLACCFIPSSSATRLRCSFSNQFILAFRSSLAFFFPLQVRHLSCCVAFQLFQFILYLAGNGFCSFLSAVGICVSTVPATPPFPVCRRCMAAVISSDVFTVFFLDDIIVYWFDGAVDAVQIDGNAIEWVSPSMVICGKSPVAIKCSHPHSLPIFSLHPFCFLSASLAKLSLLLFRKAYEFVYAGDRSCSISCWIFARSRSFSFSCFCCSSSQVMRSVP